MTGKLLFEGEELDAVHSVRFEHLSEVVVVTFRTSRAWVVAPRTAYHLRLRDGQRFVVHVTDVQRDHDTDHVTGRADPMLVTLG